MKNQTLQTVPKRKDPLAGSRPVKAWHSSGNHEDMMHSSEGLLVVSEIFQGEPASPGMAAGRAFVIADSVDLSTVPEGAIAVCRGATRNLISAMPRIKGLITESGGILALAFSAARENEVPAVAGVRGLIRSVKNGDVIGVNGTTGEIRLLSNVTAGRH